MSRDLVVIEAPGKIRTFHRIFAQIGFPAEVCATLGHVLENPQTLKDIAIERVDGSYSESMRLPYRPVSYQYLQEQIKKCSGRLIIATDNDNEGHVIAQDVADLARKLKPSLPILRMLSGGLDAQSIHQALGDLRPLDPEASVAGTARRITDRIIGGTLSDFELNRPVGRVQSALLGMCESPGLAHSVLQVRLPCKDGGKPFLGNIPIYGSNNSAKLIAELGGLQLPAATVVKTEIVPMAKPLAYGDALVELNRNLGLDIEKAANLLQQMYESGDISYARTDSRSFTQAGAESIARIARSRALLVFKKENLPLVNVGTAHEAIRVLNESLLAKLDIGKPLKLHDSDRDAVLSFIARRSIESGVPIQRDYPEISELPAWAQQVDWKRDTKRFVLPWRYPDPDQVVGRDLKVALIEGMVEHGIGRPSTYAQHAARFAERDLVDYKYEVNPKGEDWLQQAPESLRDAKAAAKIEHLFDAQDLGVDEIIDRAIAMAVSGDEKELEAIYEKLAEHPEQDEEPDDDEYRYRPAF